MATAGPGAGTATVRRRFAVDRFELVVFVAFALVSCWTLALDLRQVIFHGRVWTGTDGFFITDQMQYLAWIQSASHHLLVSNLFVLRHTPSDYFQPAIALSGLAVALGMVPWLALLLWKPVAVIVTFFGIRAYAHHTFSDTTARRTALALGLFYGSFTSVYGSFGVIGDLFPGFLSWGYPFGLIALGAMLYALIGYDRARSAGRIVWGPALLGALASSLHPWQGETLILIVLGAEAVNLRRERLTRKRAMLIAITVIGTALPLVYYLILGQADINWGLAREASRHSFPFWSIGLVLVPILPFALLGYRGRSRSFWELGVRVFPFATLAIYFFSASGASATPLHAFQGITVPLAVLAVTGLRRSGWYGYRHRKLIGGIVLALATIPASVWELKIANGYMGPQPGNANFITRDERNALNYIRHQPGKGGVLTRAYLGLTVPARTGRPSFLGDCLWSQPRCSDREVAVKALFDGQLSAPQARSFVRETGARFLLGDCRSDYDVTQDLAPLLVDEQSFGCARVWEVRSPVPATGPLAESRAHAVASVRTSGRQQRRVQRV